MTSLVVEVEVIDIVISLISNHIQYCYSSILRTQLSFSLNSHFFLLNRNLLGVESRQVLNSIFYNISFYDLIIKLCLVQSDLKQIILKKESRKSPRVMALA